MTRHEPRVCPRHGTPLSSDGYCDECGGPAPEEDEAPDAETSDDASLDYESGAGESG